MRDIPPDAMRSAYRVISGTRFRGMTRDIAVLVVAQAILDERNRVVAVVKAIKRELAAAGDGGSAHSRSMAIDAVERVHQQVISGEAVEP